MTQYIYIRVKYNITDYYSMWTYEYEGNKIIKIFYILYTAVSTYTYYYYFLFGKSHENFERTNRFQSQLTPMEYFFKI